MLMLARPSKQLTKNDLPTGSQIFFHNGPCEACGHARFHVHMICFPTASELLDRKS